MNGIMGNIFLTVTLICFVFIHISLETRLIQLLSSIISMRKYINIERYADYSRFNKSENMLPVSIIVPAYNSAKNIVNTVNNLLNIDFPEYEVIIVNDGSNDNTLVLLKLEYELVLVQQPFKKSLDTPNIKAIYRSPSYANLVVVDKHHSGKAEAMNIGVNISSYSVVVMMDADTVLEQNALSKIVMPFVSDNKVAAVSGIVRMASEWEINRGGQPRDTGLSQNPLICLQTVEYNTMFLTGRMGIDALSMMLVTSGVFCAFNKKVLVEAGGYPADCIGYDAGLIMNIHRNMRKNKRKYAVKFLTNPVCWSKSPESVSQLAGQRKYWHTSLIDALKKHKDIMFNKNYGSLGMLKLPYYWLFEVLGPFIEIICYIALLFSVLFGVLNWQLAVSMYALAGLFGVALSLGAMLLEEGAIRRHATVRELIRLVFYTFLYNFIYRQVNSFLCVMAMFTFKKSKQEFNASR